MIPLAKNGDDSFVDFDATESPLEEMFAWQMKGTRLKLAGVFTQVPIIGYRVDFLIQHKGRSIVVELDGRRYHDRKRDDERDSLIINHVDEIIRIPYSAMINENATMIAIGKWCDRFEVSQEITTCTYKEAIREYELACWSRGYYEPVQYDNLDYLQVYTEHEARILVGTFKQIAMGHDILPITRRLRKSKQCRE